MTETYKRPDDFDPDTHFPPDHKRAGLPRCQGWSRQQGRQCRNSPVEGRDYCRFHGGKNPRGSDNGSFKHGLYMKALNSVDMSERFEAMLEDDELITLRREIAVITLQVEEAIENEDWERAQNLVETKRRLVRDEAKRVKDEGHYLPVSSYRQLMQRIIGSIVEALPGKFEPVVVEAVRRVESGRTTEGPIGQLPEPKA